MSIANKTIETTNVAGGDLEGFSPLVGAPHKPVLSSAGRGWQNIGALQICFKEQRIAAPPLPNHVVMLCLSGSFWVSAKIGEQNFERILYAGESSILPAGIKSDWRVRAECQKALENGILQMYLRPEFLRRIAGDCEMRFEDARLETIFCRADVQTSSIGLMLLEELKIENLMSRYRADLLAELLAINLLSAHPEATKQEVEYKGGLPPKKLRRVKEYIDENLDNSLGLIEIAAAVEMNAFHFARQFKQATGTPPHRFIVARRIERAKELLKQTKMPIIEISLEVGIQSQNHFTTLFCRLTGHTPKQFRDLNS